MERDDITQDTLAVKLGIKPQNITYYIRGTGMPKIESLIIMRELFNASIDDILLKDYATTKVEEPEEVYETKSKINSEVNYLSRLMIDANERFNEIQKAITFLHEFEVHNQGT